MSVSLLFDGDIELNSDISEADGYQFQVLASSKRGNPIPVEVTLASFLRDGAIVEIDGNQNREMTLQVRVTAPDLLVLALGEKRLKLATEKRTTLVWTPADGIGPATVFEVMTSNLIEPQDDGWDLAEVRNKRTYRLRLVCLPFARSVDKFTDDADTPASTGSVQDSCETTTGWSSHAGATAPVVDAVVYAEGAGSVKCEAYSLTSSVPWIYGVAYSAARNIDTKALSISTGAGGYLSVLIRLDWPDGAIDKPSTVTIRQKLASTGSTQTTVDASAVATVADGWVRYAWPVAGGDTVTELEFDVFQAMQPYGQTVKPFVRYDAITFSDAATTDKQIVKVFDVPGSARGPGSLYVSSPDDGVGLGKVLAITVPESAVKAGFQPDVLRWVTSGSSTADATALHGYYYTAGTPDFDVPVSMLSPGPYRIVALVKSGANPLAIGVSAQLRVSGSDVGPVSAASVSLPTTGAYQFVTIGTLYLPPVPMQNPGASCYVRLKFTGATQLAEAFMVPDAADFSIVDAGSYSHLWIDSPDAAQPRGGWWAGVAAGRAGVRSVWPDVKKAGRHIYSPGRMAAYVAVTNAQGPRVTLEGYPWWFGNAAS